MIKFTDDMTPLDRVDFEGDAYENMTDKREESPRKSAIMPENMQSECMKNMPLAMVYSPIQEWKNIYTPEEALKKGTLFADLYFPWLAE